MDNFNLKSILLGIGIGIILTSTISIIYLAGRDPSTELTEQEIIKLADKYGLVRSTQLINNESQNKSATDILQVK